MRGMQRSMARWRVAALFAVALGVVAAHLTVAPAARASTDLSLLFAHARAIGTELQAKAETAASAGPLGSIVAERAKTTGGHLADAERPAHEGRHDIAAMAAARLLGTLNDVENAALHFALGADDTDHVRFALDIHTVALRMNDVVVSLAQRLVGEHHRDEATPAAPTAGLPSRADALRAALATAIDAASTAADPASSSADVLAARDTAVAVAPSTWSRSTLMHQAAFALTATSTTASTNLCNPSAGDPCIVGWAEDGTDPRVAAVLQAIGDADQASAELYYNTFYPFLPPSVSAALDLAMSMEGDALATVGSAIDSLNIDEATETTAGANGRDRNGDCCATTPYKWERSGVLYFYYCYQQCSYPAGMRFELNTTLANFSAVPYDGYFTHYYGPSIYISRYEVPMREDIVSNPDKTKATYSCGIGSLPLSCYSTRTSPTSRGHYYFNETRVTARPAGYPDRGAKWQTRRWVPYSATQADFPAYQSGG